VSQVFGPARPGRRSRVVARVLEAKNHPIEERPRNAQIVFATEVEVAEIRAEPVRFGEEEEAGDRPAQGHPAVVQPCRGVLKKCSVQPLKP
jgi:hypothetical protein